MNFDELIGVSSRIFFHPFKTFSDLTALFQNQTKQKVIRYSILASLMGNLTFILVSMVMAEDRVWGSIGFFLFHCVLALVWIYFIDFIILGMFNLLVSIFKENAVDFSKLIGLYFMSYFVYIILLPIAVLFKLILPDSGSVYSIVLMVISIFVFLLKMKAAVISCSISFGKALGLYVLPFLVMVLLVFISMGYFVIYFIKLLV
jgi:hypothetical protein